MTITKFLPGKSEGELKAQSVSYQSPSNIALIKYWGKHGLQIPKNPSISFTLDNCRTTTTLNWKERTQHQEDYELKVILDGKHKPGFEPKIHQFFWSRGRVFAFY